MLEKTVTLYLMDDGDLNGRIECTIGNWDGTIYKIPRTQKELCDNKESTLKKRLEQAGIYFLFGETKSDPKKKTVYVGKADSKNSAVGAWTRVNGHHTEDSNEEGTAESVKIDDWEEAVIVVHAKAASFLGGAGLSYLENKFYWIADDADEAGYYKMLNGNEPNSARRSIRHGDKSEADDFVEHVKTVMRVLGYGDLFEAYDKNVGKKNRNMFRMKYRGNRARMEKCVDGFWLQKGSWISKPPPEPTEGPKKPKPTEDTKKPKARYPKKLRDYWNSDEYVDKDNNILKKPIRFDRASTPATFVKGAPSDYSRWRNFEGEMVDEVEGKELQDDE